MCRQHMQCLSYLLETSPGSIFWWKKKIHYINKLQRVTSSYLLFVKRIFFFFNPLPDEDKPGEKASADTTTSATASLPHHQPPVMWRTEGAAETQLDHSALCISQSFLSLPEPNADISRHSQQSN